MTINPSNCTILVVDDEEAVLSIIARMLSRSGFTVLTAPNGPSAIEMVKTGIQPVQVVLIDLSMPGMDGEAAARELGSLLPDAGLILMSGYQPEVLTGRYPDLGVKGFLQKPFTRDALNTTVQAVIATLGESDAHKRAAGGEISV